MIKLLVLIGLTCGACAIVPPVGPQAGGAAVQVLLSKTNDNKLDEKPRFAAAVKAAAAPAPGKPAPAPPPPAPAPAPAPAPVPVQVQPPAPLPTVTQAPPPPAIPVPKPVITPEFLQLFQAAFGRGATTTPPVTAPPTVANPFAQLFQSAMMPRMQLGMRGMFGRSRANMQNMFGQSYYPTTSSYSYFNRGAGPRMCFGECKTELCDFPEREIPGFCPGKGRKPKRCCSWF